MQWINRMGSGDKIRDQQTSPLVHALLFPVRIVAAWIAFLINSWTVTRESKPFLLAIPALATATGVGGVLWLDYYLYPDRVARAQRYYETFLITPDRGPAFAKIFAMKQVNLEPESDSAKYNLASMWESLEEPFKAEDLMTCLVKKDYIPAHNWFARRYMLDRNLDREGRDKLILKHLESAIALNPEDNQTKLTLADHLLTQASEYPKEAPEYRQLLEESCGHMTTVLEKNPIDMIRHLPKLILVLVELDQQERAEAVYEQARKLLLQIARQMPGDERIPELWRVLTMSAIQLKNYKIAAELIDEGRRTTSGPRMKSVLDAAASTLVIKQASDFENLEDPEQFKSALDVLCLGVLNSPADPAISSQLIELILPERKDGKDLAGLLTNIQATKAPAVAHLLLGIHKVSRGDVLGGQTHWKIAQTQYNGAQIVLFSMIRSLVNEYASQFPNLDDIIALAIEQYPDQGLFYFLRGMKHMNAEQFSEAIPSLVQASKMVKEPNNFEVHAMLAWCYHALKDQENEDDQRIIMQKLLGRANPSTRPWLEQIIARLDERVAAMD